MSNFSEKKIDYKQYVIDSQLRYFKPHATKIEKSFAEEISYSKILNLLILNFSMTERGLNYLNPLPLFLNIIPLELKLVF